ncbi:hypothetical protein CYMTET_25499 [Cymbomonas tetramitiformis]|uniref:Uncharacterized protein n=1 Tax=Cymbomonas tetramitiformis TaxID=36881 RepID=A0AAE0KYW2_9CHLO|nr:hypothetical protein CYMTET_25499 [Cymbomonas tetramitiformis]
MRLMQGMRQAAPCEVEVVHIAMDEVADPHEARPGVLVGGAVHGDRLRELPAAIPTSPIAFAAATVTTTVPTASITAASVPAVPGAASNRCGTTLPRSAWWGAPGGGGGPGRVTGGLVHNQRSAARHGGGLCVVALQREDGGGGYVGGGKAGSCQCKSGYGCTLDGHSEYWCVIADSRQCNDEEYSVTLQEYWSEEPCTGTGPMEVMPDAGVAAIVGIAVIAVLVRTRRKHEKAIRKENVRKENVESQDQPTGTMQGNIRVNPLFKMIAKKSQSGDKAPMVAPAKFMQWKNKNDKPGGSQVDETSNPLAPKPRKKSKLSTTGNPLFLRTASQKSDASGRIEFQSMYRPNKVHENTEHSDTEE